MTTLDYLADACQRVIRGNPTDWRWTWFQCMSAEDKLRFDNLLVRTGDELAHQPGTPESRFAERVRRMVKLQQTGELT